MEEHQVIQSAEDRVTALRSILEDIDAKLLALLDGARPLDDATLQKTAMLESARSAVHRLLSAAEAQPLQDTKAGPSPGRGAA